MNEKQKKHYLDSFDSIFDHRMEFADHVAEYLLNISVKNFRIKRVYAAYDTFQNRLCEGELPDEEIVLVKERNEPVVEMKKKDGEVFIRIKVPKKWIEVKCPLEMVKFADWWLYT